MFGEQKQEPFLQPDKYELIAITGLTGAGKTSFATAIAQEVFRDKMRMQMCMSRIYALRNMGFLSLQPPRCMIYADFGLVSTQGVPCNYINGFDLGVPVDYRENALLPPHIVIILDEAPKYFNNRNTQSFPEFVEQFFQLHRHARLTIMMCYQDLDDIDLKIRKLLHRVIIVKEQRLDTKRFEIDRQTGMPKVRSVTWSYDEYKRFGNKSAYQWATNDNVRPIPLKEKKQLMRRAYGWKTKIPFRWFLDREARQEIDAVRERLYYSQAVEDKEYYFPFDIFKLYDSFYFAPVFYRIYTKSFPEYLAKARLLRYSNTPAPLSPADIQQFYRFNSLVRTQRPTDYVKAASGAKIKQDKEKKENGKQ